ncbi:MAG TPA: serine hydrolase [Chloroflexota bacterium]
MLVGSVVVLVMGVVGVRAFVSGASATTAAVAAPNAAAQSDALPSSSQASGAAAPTAWALLAATQGPATVRQWDTNVPGVINDPMLASRLDQALAGVDGHVGVAVKDLGSGRGAVLGGNLELQSASLYKLPVLYTVFDVGLKMSEELTISDEALSYDTGTMELGAGETLSIAELLERMVTLSDNTSAVMLGSRVGAGNVDASIAALGMTTTHYSLDRMTSSALDMLHLVEQVADAKAVSPSASADMLHLLLRQRVNDRLPRLLPDNVQVAHKTGNLPGVVNDVGILYGPNSTVAVAALVSDTTDETAAATAIAQIGLVASSYFEEQPAVQDRPLILPPPSRPIPPVWREPRPPTPTPRPVVVPTAIVQRAVQVEVTPRATQVAEATPTPTLTQEFVIGASPTAVVAAATVAAKPTLPPAIVAPPTSTHAAVAAPTATPAPAPPTPTPAPAPPTKAPTAAAAQPTPARTVAPTPVPPRR